MRGRGMALSLAIAPLLVAGVSRWLRARRPLDLEGKVVIITGGSRGLGLLLAEEFAAQGARIAICARDPGRLERARHRLESLGAEVFAEPCDVGDRTMVNRFVQEVIRHYGRVDFLVNNAGVMVVAPLSMRSVEDIDEAMRVMFWGAVHTTFAVLPGMRARGGGVIVNITSIGGKVSVPHLLPYAGAKFAAVGFSEGLRAELAPHHIEVVTVVPGLMRTGSYMNGLFGGRRRGEYGWFSLLSSLPLVSMDARAAARRIVRGVQRHEAEVTLTPLAQVAVRFHGLFPGTTVQLAGLAARLMPSLPEDGSRDVARGWQSESFVTRSFLTSLGRDAAQRLLQTDPLVPPPGAEPAPAAASAPRRPAVAYSGEAR